MADRLFNVYIFAGLHGPDTAKGVPVVRRRRADDVDGFVVEDASHVLDEFGAFAGFLFDGVAAVLTHFFVDVDDVGDFAILAAAKGADVTAAATFAADHRTKKLFIGARSLPHGKTADQWGGRGRGKHRVGQELSASQLFHDSCSFQFDLS